MSDLITYDKEKNLDLKCFTGGYIDNLQDFRLPEGNSPYLRNVRLNGMGVQNRKVAVSYAAKTLGSA